MELLAYIPPQSLGTMINSFVKECKNKSEMGVDLLQVISERLQELESRQRENEQLNANIEATEDRLTKFEDMYINNFPGRTRAFVKIEDGCENFCSYCIIPFVRGKCRSKDFNKTIEEIVDYAVNQYIIEKEYTEFIDLLKLYIDSKESRTNNPLSTEAFLKHEPKLINQYS